MFGPDCEIKPGHESSAAVKDMPGKKYDEGGAIDAEGAEGVQSVGGGGDKVQANGVVRLGSIVREDSAVDWAEHQHRVGGQAELRELQGDEEHAQGVAQHQLAGDAHDHGEVVGKGAEQVPGGHGHWRVVQGGEVGQVHSGHPCDEHERGNQDQGGGTVPPSFAPVARSSRGKKFARRTRPKFRKGVQPVGKNLTIWKESKSLRELLEKQWTRQLGGGVPQDLTDRQPEKEERGKKIYELENLRKRRRRGRKKTSCVQG